MGTNPDAFAVVLAEKVEAAMALAEEELAAPASCPAIYRGQHLQLLQK